MREHVGMEQVRFVEQEDGVHLVAPKIAHVGFDGHEEIDRRRGRLKPERVAEQAVEVAPTEAGVAATRGRSIETLRPPNVSWLRAVPQ
jgi:hypothetical protein